ncbi:hypothetical protein BC829DRAFT_380149 [Chytridium lagenaria]|nr:hypothetical protein BC829DRAFT_380149 [Chytridium lagenaria]
MAIEVEDSTDWPPQADFLRVIESHFRCTICSEFMAAASILPCRHSFCSVCIRRHLLTNEDFLKNKDKDIRLCTNFDVAITTFKNNREALLQMAGGSVATPRPPPLTSKPKTKGRNHDRPKAPISIPSSPSSPTQNAGKSHSIKPTKRPEIDTRKAAVPYDMMKDGQLRKLLIDEGLPSNGDKTTLKRRHREYMIRLQANRDSLEPRPEDEIRQEFIVWEQTVTKVQGTSAHIFHTNSHEEDPDTKMILQKHAVKFKQDFDDLTEQIRQRKKRRVEKTASSVGVEPESHLTLSVEPKVEHVANGGCDHQAAAYKFNAIPEAGHSMNDVGDGDHSYTAMIPTGSDGFLGSFQDSSSSSNSNNVMHFHESK